MATFGGNFPPRNEFPPLTNQTSLASRIHSAKGCIIYSTKTKEITTERIGTIEGKYLK